MAKLTNEMKNKIITGLVNDAYKASEFAEIREGLIKEVKKHPFIRKGMELIKRYPEYIDVSTSIFISSGFSKYSEEQQTMFMNIYVCNSYGNYFSADYEFCTKGYFTLYEHIDELSEKGQAFWDRLVDFCNGKVTFKKNLEQIVNSVNTTKQLLDILPEAKKYIPEEISNFLIPMDCVKSVREVLQNVVCTV